MITLSSVCRSRIRGSYTITLGFLTLYVRGAEICPRTLINTLQSRVSLVLSTQNDDGGLAATAQSIKKVDVNFDDAYMYMYVCMYVYMYVCMHACTYDTFNQIR